MSIPPFGAAPTPDATSLKKGKIKLAGDLAGGTAALPTLTAIGAGAVVGSSTLIPVITYDTKGRITGSTTAAVAASVDRAFPFFVA